jgi:RNA recognition motif-containing protein
MARKLFVGNLSPNTTEDAVARAFAPYGATAVSLAANEGFGFVYVEDTVAALAIQEMDGRILNGEAIVVRESLLREAAPTRQELEDRMYYDPYSVALESAYRFS